MNHSPSTHGPVSPWWRHGMVWLVFGGPAAVVLACAVTLVLVLTHPDPVLQMPAAQASQQPALQSRNHAASPR